MPFRDPEEKRKYHRAYQAYRAKTHTSVKVTMKTEVYLKFFQYAKAQKQSVARTILKLAEQKHQDTPLLHPEAKSKLDEITLLLRASGNNINQIAHACNIRVMRDDDLPTENEGSQYLKSIHEGMMQLELLIEQKLS